MALASPTRLGRDVGDPVVVKIAIGGRDLLAYAIVLRLAHSVAEMYLVAVAQQMDPRAREGQVLRAGDVPFIPMNVRGAEMFRDMRTACQVTGLDADDNLAAAPDVDVQAGSPPLWRLWRADSSLRQARIQTVRWHSPTPLRPLRRQVCACRVSPWAPERQVPPTSTSRLRCRLPQIQRSRK